MFVLSSFVLKLIAVITMLIDHTAVALLPFLGAHPDIISQSRNIGRIAAPIFAFFIAEGARHTKSMGNYVLRLFILAILSELFFDLALVNARVWRVGGAFNISFFYMTNIFYTLTAAALSIWAYKILKEKFDMPILISVAPTFILAFIIDYIRSDFGSILVLMIFLLYIIDGGRDMRRRLIALSVMVVMLGVIYWGWLFVDPTLYFYSLIAVVLLLFYNGKRGFNNKAVQWGFYFMYPLHLMILSLLLWGL